MHIWGSLSWEYHTSLLLSFKNKIWADPSSYKDRWCSKHVTSCRTLLQCLCKLWFYPMSQASHSTSLFLPSLPIGLLWMLTNHQAHQEFSSSPKKYSYDVESDIFLLFLSSIICSINHIRVPTKNLSLLTSSSWSKAFFENYRHLFHTTSSSCSNHFKPSSESSIYLTLTSAIDPSAYNNRNISATSIYTLNP